MKLPEEYQEAREKIEMMQEDIIDKIQILQQKMITLEEDMDKLFTNEGVDIK